MIIDVPQALSLRLRPAPDRRLTEKSHFGLLPRVGADGARPADVYARPVFASTPSSGPARRASPCWSAASASTPPAPPTRSRGCRRPCRSASRPMAPTSTRDAAQAREAGHEILLQAPMEPFAYPSDDPGPHTLLTGASDAENLEFAALADGAVCRLCRGRESSRRQVHRRRARAVRRRWPRSRARGLFYLDDGSSPRSLAPRDRADARPGPAPPTSSSTPTRRRRRSTRRWRGWRRWPARKGAAIGVATALPVERSTISRAGRAGWRRSGIALVPVSALTPRARPGARRPDAEPA